MRLYTIGFTKKTAEEFFGLLREAGAWCVVDVRLNPRNQLTSFTNQRHLPYLLQELLNCGYVHLPLLAPAKEIITDYRQDKDWQRYERRYKRQLEQSNAIQHLDQSVFTDSPACLLCSEEVPDKCHRRLAAEYLASFWPQLQIKHLV